MRSRPLSHTHSPERFLALLIGFAILIPRAAPASAAESVSSRLCQTLDPTAEEAAGAHSALAARDKAIGPSDLGGIVQVAFHVLHDGANGNVTDEQIQAQIAELNLDFSGAFGGFDTGYRFVLTSVDRTLDPDWFTMEMGSQIEKRAKEALAVDPVHHVNVYTAEITSYGWSSFPWGVDEDDTRQGIVVDYQTLPGGSLDGFNLGRTVTHEMGHYFGLFHTFFTGCVPPDDYVEDTPAEAVQATGCPEGLDTCPSPGADPVHNYMDYSNDPCYLGFTAGQDERMDGMIALYRPNLIAGPVAVAGPRAGSGVSFRPVMPNPAGGVVRLAFALPRAAHVTLRVYDLAGRAVATLADGRLPAGEHARRFDPGSGSSGVYFAVLSAEGVRITRRIVVAE